jgi:nucleoside-diphosphate-sugar epimerase
MHVFITGGTGLIGSAVVAELLGHDHTVLALVRSDASALAAETAGAEILRGDLADLDSLRAGAGQSDGVIHLAFANDFSSPDALARAVAEESAALATLGEELIGSDRPLVTVSGTPAVAGRSLPKPTRYRPRVRSPVAPDLSRLPSAWLHKGSRARPSACRALSTTMATADSPVY